jgi:hypothetical protein
MQASIEIFVNRFDEEFHKLLQNMANEKGHTYEYTNLEHEHSYCIMLGHDYWNSYRYFLLKYVQEHLPVKTRLEFDRQGDEMDKYILYTYEGGTKFHMNYKTKNIFINGYIDCVL